MPPRALHPSFATGFNDAPPAPDRRHDIEWDRPVFRPPFLPNPRVVFDPPPFRTQLFGAFHRVRRMVRR
jgi:hypothetical protein